MSGHVGITEGDLVGANVVGISDGVLVGENVAPLTVGALEDGVDVGIAVSGGAQMSHMAHLGPSIV